MLPYRCGLAQSLGLASLVTVEEALRQCHREALQAAKVRLSLIRGMTLGGVKLGREDKAQAESSPPNEMDS